MSEHTTKDDDLVSKIFQTLKDKDPSNPEEIKTVEELKKRIHLIEYGFFAGNKTKEELKNLVDNGESSSFYTKWEENKRKFEQELKNKLSSIQAIGILLKNANAHKPNTVSASKWDVYKSHSEYMRNNKKDYWVADSVQLQKELWGVQRIASNTNVMISGISEVTIDKRLLLFVEYYMLQQILKDCSRYSRNELFINKTNQDIIKSTPLVILGLNVGSWVAEDALRLGFEHIILHDGYDTLSDIDKKTYNYTSKAKSKTEALKQRLEDINDKASITVATNINTIPNSIGSQTNYVVVNDTAFSEENRINNVFQKDNVLAIVYPFELGEYGGGLPLKMIYC